MTIIKFIYLQIIVAELHVARLKKAYDLAGTSEM